MKSENLRTDCPNCGEHGKYMYDGLEASVHQCKNEGCRVVEYQLGTKQTEPATDGGGTAEPYPLHRVMSAVNELDDRREFSAEDLVNKFEVPVADKARLEASLRELARSGEILDLQGNESTDADYRTI